MSLNGGFSGPRKLARTVYEKSWRDRAFRGRRGSETIWRQSRRFRFVIVDHVQHRSALKVSGLAHLRLERRGYVEAARFEDKRHDG
jgi:hypothetical protein